jgi:hypothetical protein
MHVAPGILRGQDGVRVVAIRAARSVLIPLAEQQLAVTARSQLGKLIGVQAVLPHLCGIRMTRRTDRHRPKLIRGPDETPAVRGRGLERRGVAAVTVVAANPALGVDPEGKRAAFVGVAHDTAV